MTEEIVVAPTENPRLFRASDGRILEPPPGWVLLPPGDSGLTRRVKKAGPTWKVEAKRGRKTFSRGIWAPAEHVESARAALEVERSNPAYAKRLAQAADRRARIQDDYEVEFESAVRAFLAFGVPYAALADRLAKAVTSHATPVGSGTVARTTRIPVEERAESAVIAWLRHATTAYDHVSIPHVKGARRQVRRQLARQTRTLLDEHRREVPHGENGCPLCRTLAESQGRR